MTSLAKAGKESSNKMEQNRKTELKDRKKRNCIGACHWELEDTYTTLKENG